MTDRKSSHRRAVAVGPQEVQTLAFSIIRRDVSGLLHVAREAYYRHPSEDLRLTCYLLEMVFRSTDAKADAQPEECSPR